MRKRFVASIVLSSLLLIPTTASAAVSYYTSGPIKYAGWQQSSANVNLNQNFIYSNNTTYSRTVRLRTYRSGSVFSDTGNFNLSPGNVGRDVFYVQFVGRPQCWADLNMYGGCGVGYY